MLALALLTTLPASTDAAVDQVASTDAAGSQKRLHAPVDQVCLAKVQRVDESADWMSDCMSDYLPDSMSDGSDESTDLGDFIDSPSVGMSVGPAEDVGAFTSLLEAFSPDSVCLVPAATDVPEPDTQQEQGQQPLSRKRRPVFAARHGQGAGPRKRHSSARGTALQMMGRLGPYGCAVVLSAAACVQEHTPSDVLANLRPIYRQEWTTELTDLLHTAIKNEGGLRVAKPAAVLDEMRRLGDEQGLPDYVQVQNKLQRLKVAEEKRKQTDVPVSPDSVYLVPGTTDVPEPDTQLLCSYLC